MNKDEKNENNENEKHEKEKNENENNDNNSIFMLFNSVIQDDLEKSIIKMIIENKDPEYILEKLLSEKK